MPAKRFLIHYPDGSKEQISLERRNELQLRNELRQIDSKRYHFVGIFVAKTLRCKGFEGLRPLLPTMTAEQLKRYLERLEVIFALEQARIARAREGEEKPEGLYARLVAMGMPAAGFEQAVATQ